MRIDLDAIGVVKSGGSKLEVLIYSEFSDILEGLTEPEELVLIHRGKRPNVRQIEVSPVKMEAREGNLLTISGLTNAAEDHAVIDIRTKSEFI